MRLNRALGVIFVQLPRAEDRDHAVAQQPIKARLVATEERLQAGKQPIHAGRRGFRLSFAGQPDAEDGDGTKLALCATLTL